MLTPFDEMPVHQTPYPFSVPASTDVAFDDGYYLGVLSDNGQDRRVRYVAREDFAHSRIRFDGDHFVDPPDEESTERSCTCPKFKDPASARR